MGSISHSLNAQTTCTLACSDRVEVPLGANCEVRITPGLVFTDGGAQCPGDKNIILRDSEENIISQGTNEIIIDLSAYVDTDITAVVIDQETRVSCSTILEIRDNESPKLDCGDALITCLGDTSVASIGMPDISDNCDANLVLTHSDEIVSQGNDCDEGVLVLTRSWLLVDGSGNEARCTQNIVLERPELTDVDFPANVELGCEDPDASPENTGFPTIDGERVQTTDICGLVVTYQDDTTSIDNGNGQRIARQWLIVRRCDGTTDTHEQIILIRDGVQPTIDCPDDFTVNTSVGECTAVVFLPSPTIDDNCDDNVSFFAQSSFGRDGIGPFGGIEVGQYTIEYTAVDGSNNMQSCFTSFTVVDNETPNAICDDQVIVSLVEGGIAIARAVTFDEGSRDNCAPQIFYKAKRLDDDGCVGLNGDDSPTMDGVQEWYDDFVFFCCEDLEVSAVPVGLRVFTVDPGEGGIDPTRMAPGGDLFGTFNDCDGVVTVQDKIKPVLTCPPPVTIDCRESTRDLSIFGSPIIQEACMVTLDSLDVRELDDCGTGSIFRTFSATDGSGNTGTCTQVITIQNEIALQYENITWPMNVDTNLCGVTLLPEDLPDGFNRPVIDFESCSITAQSFTDTRFDVSFPACYKILRQWSVIDWCQFNENTDSDGRFTYTQTLKVSDDVAPAISCAEDITVGINGGSCDMATLNIPLATATDNCSPSISISNDSDFATDDRANASGVYPLGTTTVTFTALDNCGNLSRCEVDVTVVDDKAPAPICIEGIAAALSRGENDEILATVSANIFLASSTFDECHPREDITLSVRKAIDNPPGPPTGQTTLTFSCDEIGRQEIELWVTDRNGNSDYCITGVNIQDNNNICPQTTMGFIAGNIQTQTGKEVEEVVVSVMNNQPLATMTDVGGGFTINGIEFGSQVTLIPSKADDILNGVSTMDVIAISQHILGVKPITSPYTLIAADIDGSGGVSTIDLIRLRKIILSNDKAFPNGTPSWRFIDADFQFPEGVDPLKVDFPELKNVASFNTALGAVRFIAIKVGDVNGSVKPNSILQGESRTTNGDVVMKVKDQDFESGETFTVDIYSEDLFNLIGLQFTLDYDERLVELVDFEAGDLPRMDRENFGIVDSEKGLITTSWSENNSVLTLDKAVVCRLTFRSIRAGDLYTALAINSDPTLAEAYDYNTDPMQVLLQFVEADGQASPTSDFKLYQNHPNPFRNHTKIGFVLPKRATATLSIYDISGKEVYRLENEFNVGYQELEINSSILPAHGLYYYRLQSEEFSTTRKMIYTISQ
ncbi:MAG: hypothetical protein Sapg2KO_45840 [Saprospiraceae bacterium]